MLLDYSLYLISDPVLVGKKDFWESVEGALRGGVTLLQLREKDGSSREFFQIGLKMKELANKYQVPLIVNDRLDIALAIDADGVHIGQDDLPLNVARQLLGRDKILGYSVANTEQAVLGQQLGADYLGAGAVFPTGSKQDAGEAIGLESLAKIVDCVSLPVVAIGGINKTNLLEVKQSGAAGVSLISAILSQENPEQAARELKTLWQMQAG